MLLTCQLLICVIVDLLLEKNLQVLDEKVDCWVLFGFVWLGFVLFWFFFWWGLFSKDSFALCKINFQWAKEVISAAGQDITGI